MGSTKAAELLGTVVDGRRSARDGHRTGRNVHGIGRDGHERGCDWHRTTRDSHITTREGNSTSFRFPIFSPFELVNSLKTRKFKRFQ